MKKLNLRSLYDRGDTIVEVLIAIAVVSLVLAAAFTSTRRSASATRTAQEHGEALKLAESQVEQIKVASEKGEVLPNSFCFDGGVAKPLPEPACTTGTVAYRQSITKAGNDYVVIVQWDGLSGGTNNVELDYSTQ